jgi:hypothetical protein
MLRPQGFVIFDYIQSYRYAIQSIFDLINGFSILFGLYKVSMYAQIKRKKLHRMTDIFANKTKDLSQSTTPKQSYNLTKNISSSLNSNSKSISAVYRVSDNAAGG